MSLPLSREVGSVLSRAEQMAVEMDEHMSSAHVLLALFEVPNQAAKLLEDRGITAATVRAAMKELGSEALHVLEKVQRRSERLAEGSRAEAITSLHLLAALVRETRSHAQVLLKSCGADIGAIRTAVMSYATAAQRGPRRYTTVEMRPVSRHSVDGSATTPARDWQATPIGFHPSLGVGSRGVRPQREVVDEPQGSVQTPEAPVAPTREPAERTQPSIDALRETGEGLSLDNHPGINRGGRPRQPVQQRPPERTEAEKEAQRQAQALDDARKTTRDLAKRLIVAQRAAEPNEDEEGEVLAGPPEPPLRALPSKADPVLAARYRLDDEDFPYLTKFGRNLTEEAALGRIDAVIGRDSEIAQLIDILGKRRSNNPLLVGEPGVGKTAIVEGLARRFVEMARNGQAAGERTIIELEMGRLLSGTHLRGAFSERLLGIKDEVAQAHGSVVVFLDEIHGWMSAGAGGDGGDAAGELKTALARGRFPCIGATTQDEFRKFIETDSAFERRFQQVTVEEPDEETAVQIVEGVRPQYERHHGVCFSAEAVRAAVSLSVRYIHDRQLPDKAIGVLDLAGSRASRRGSDGNIVDRVAVAEVVADVARIPVERLTRSQSERFLKMESFLARGVIGHSDVVRTISELLRRNYAGFRSHRPIGSLLFLGPTGVGKTEMVKVLADFLFHDREAIVRLDMSEYMEAHSVSRLIGSPPGYVGYDQGGQLTEALRKRPYQVVLFDEVEKAHADVLNLLLQLFDEGRLTDGRGRVVDFSNALVVMTSNLGASVFEEESRHSGAPIGFSQWRRPGETPGDREVLREPVLSAAREHFTPELWNRIDERLVFLPLSKGEVADIARLQLADSQRRLHEESGIEMSYEPDLIDHLIDHGGYDQKLGARPMRQTIQRLVEGAVAREILTGNVRPGGRLLVGVSGGKVVVQADLQTGSGF
jgi:ATP-dependent Clp protease ATP-binding subunit ClpC